MGPFIYETGRPHMSEAALLAGTNPELEAAEAAQQRRGRAPEKPPPHDPVLQRALDVVTRWKFIKNDKRRSRRFAFVYNAPVIRCRSLRRWVYTVDEILRFRSESEM
jgi:hypothetical protein